MRVAGLVRTSLVDYPGLVSSVIFLPGCNFDCFYCHNRALLGSEQTLIPFEEVLAHLKKRAGLIDGVVVSGGEPTLQPDLAEAIAEIKGLGFRVKLDTNGSSPETVRELLREGFCDYFAVDYKAPRARYREICGGSADPGKVLETISLLRRVGADFEVRVTVIPQLSFEDLACMAKELPPLPRFTLNRYRKPESFKPGDRVRVEARPYMQEELEGFAASLRQVQPNARASDY